MAHRAARRQQARFNWSSRKVLVLAVAALSLSACGNSDDEAASTTTVAVSTTESVPATVAISSTTVVTGPAVSLAPTSGADGKFIDVDAQNFCNLKNQSFSSQDAIQKALQDLQSAAGITAAQWTDYTTRKAGNEAIRQQVVNRYMKLCP